MPDVTMWEGDRQHMIFTQTFAHLPGGDMFDSHVLTEAPGPGLLQQQETLLQGQLDEEQLSLPTYTENQQKHVRRIQLCCLLFVVCCYAPFIVFFGHRCVEIVLISIMLFPLPMFLVMWIDDSNRHND